MAKIIKQTTKKVVPTKASKSDSLKLDRITNVERQDSLYFENLYKKQVPPSKRKGYPIQKFFNDTKDEPTNVGKEYEDLWQSRVYPKYWQGSGGKSTEELKKISKNADKTRTPKQRDLIKKLEAKRDSSLKAEALAKQKRK